MSLAAKTRGLSMIARPMSVGLSVFGLSNSTHAQEPPLQLVRYSKPSETT